ncbi:DUF4954 family protein [Dysgonomonas sp. 216]|uniref:DUF4954 family protein n=1 Tax=Dysgonomonas sp. 216 TaxID=2302934 RepID=UPI0013D2714A|nr:DUF4954 family protein [Dysgonomonas sp. 216]NDW19232.1 DUF4954 family protein [Dysgonomonas sp. 216]
MGTNTKYRKLTEQEIDVLLHNNCICTDWDNLEVADNFLPEYVKNTTFSGKVKLGVFNKEFEFKGGISKHSGIFNASIHNCVIEDNVLITNIHGYIANYHIHEDSVIENVGTIVVNKKTSFGNGTIVAVLDETGGREVAIFDKMSAHLAYIYTLYRYKPELIKKIDGIIYNYSQNQSSETGYIGKNAIVRNTQHIENVKIGNFCQIEGALSLINGSLNSNSSASVYIRNGVIAKDFIICSGTTIDNNAIINRCFIGQACKLGNGFTASDSLFFANSQGENGEACSIFAGPYTVTHHKSTLLIGGMFSFANIGSGSNQSNHAYKLGPIHQGIVERGGRTSSGSYMLWPARIGAFSLIMGKHYSHPDTSSLPFSYLIENEGKTYLVPAVNLKTVGTARDAQKWPKRDLREDEDLLDCLNLTLLNPYSIGKILEGINVLSQLQEKEGVNTLQYTYNNCIITNSALQKGLRLYRMAVDKYFGDILVQRIQSGRPVASESTHYHSNNWLDISGLIAPKPDIDKILQDIEKGEAADINEINTRFGKLHSLFKEMEWKWVCNMLFQYYDLDQNTQTENLKKILILWRDSSIELDELIFKDAEKEFNSSATIGFGADGTETDKSNDILEVRGKIEDNTFVSDIKKQIDQYWATYNALIERINN